MQTDSEPPNPAAVPYPADASLPSTEPRPHVKPTPQPALEDRFITPQKPRRGLSFWAIITALCITSLLTALENTVVTTSLPVIIQELNIGDNYVWITNVFFLSRYASYLSLTLLT